MVIILLISPSGPNSMILKLKLKFKLEWWKAIWTPNTLRLCVSSTDNCVWRINYHHHQTWRPGPWTWHCTSQGLNCLVIDDSILLVLFPVFYSCTSYCFLYLSLLLSVHHVHCNIIHWACVYFSKCMTTKFLICTMWLPARSGQAAGTLITCTM